jgi:ABC-type uncharacterized transport system permease subunit
MIELAVLIHAGFLKGAPLLWATLGGAYSERSGVINIGLEGMMLIGAFADMTGAGLTGCPWIGLLLGAVCGGLLGLVHAWVSLYWKADQIVSGMGINVFAFGLTGFLLYKIFGARGNSSAVNKLPWVQWGNGDWWSVLIFPLSPLHLLLLLVLAVTLYLFYHTRFGLRLRACGEDPSVVQSAGISVNFYRYTCVALSGMLAGLGGAQLSISDINQFSVGMSNGRGFIALAALICSGWRPGRAALICILFGIVEALAERLQAVFPDLPSRALLALPFIFALLVLSLSRQTGKPPQALGKV